MRPRQCHAAKSTADHPRYQGHRLGSARRRRADSQAWMSSHGSGGGCRLRFINAAMHTTRSQPPRCPPGVCRYPTDPSTKLISTSAMRRTLRSMRGRRAPHQFDADAFLPGSRPRRARPSAGSAISDAGSVPMRATSPPSKLVRRGAASGSKRQPSKALPRAGPGGAAAWRREAGSDAAARTGADPARRGRGPGATQRP